MATKQSVTALWPETAPAGSARGFVSVRAHVQVNVPAGREFMRRSPTITLERAYHVNESEARAAAEQWREANPEMHIRARYTVEL